MSFYIIKQYTLIEGSPALDGVPDNIDPLAWIQPEKGPATLPSPLVLDLTLNSGDYRGDIIDGFLTLYSDELKDGLEQLGIDNIRYHPVRLRDQNTNETEGGYWLTYIDGVVDCIDMEKSDIKPGATKMSFKIMSLVIDESKTNGLKIFRLKSDPTMVIINEEVKLHLEKSDCLYGVHVLKTEDYSDW